MHAMPKTLILLALVFCAGCAKPSDVTEASVARRDHILAGPHGWIDLTLHGPVAASAAASTPRAAKAASGVALSSVCRIAFLVGGEPMVQPGGDLAQADAAKSPLAYRFVVPAGALQARLRIAECIPTPLDWPIALTIATGQLTLLEFDGRALKIGATQPWEPARLEDVVADVAQLHVHGESADGTLATLTRLAIASLALNVAVLAGVAVVAFRRRKR